MEKPRKANLTDIPHIGRATFAGERFRRYWLVVGTTRELARRYLPQVKDLRHGLDGSAIGYSVTKVKVDLGIAANMLLESQDNGVKSR
jgi:hypothetical protein